MPPCVNSTLAMMTSRCCAVRRVHLVLPAHSLISTHWWICSERKSEVGAPLHHTHTHMYQAYYTALLHRASWNLRIRDLVLVLGFSGGGSTCRAASGPAREYTNTNCRILPSFDRILSHDRTLVSWKEDSWAVVNDVLLYMCNEEIGYASLPNCAYCV